MTSSSITDPPRRADNSYSTNRQALAQGAIQSLHYYLYDPALEDKRWFNVLSAIENRLMNLELQGRIGRLGPLKSAKEMIKQAVKQGAKTIVAVGTERSILEVINAASGEKVTLGIIPIAESATAKLLGIPGGEAACDVVAARRLATLDLGRANSTIFIRQAEIFGQEVVVSGDGCWRLAPENSSIKMVVINAAASNSRSSGRLELVAERAAAQGWWRGRSRRTVVPFQTARLESAEGGYLKLDELQTVNLPAMVEVIPTALKVIIGKKSSGYAG